MPETLARHIQVLSGWAFPSDGFNELEGLPLIRIRDLGSGTTEVKFKGSYDPRYVIDDGAVLIGMDGDFTVVKWDGGAALLNQRVCKVESVSEHLDQGFLYWYLMPHVAEIYRKTPQTTVRHLSASSLSGIAAPPIPVAEQRTVSEILDTLDTNIRLTEAIIEKLKQVKQGLLHDLLTRGIDANGDLRPPQGQAPHLYKDSPLGWIPAEWNISTLANLATFSGGFGFPEQYQGDTTGDIPFFKVSDMTLHGNEKWLLSANNYVSDALADRQGWRTAPAGGVAFAKVGAALLLNRRRILSVDSLVDNNMMVAVATNALDPGWLYWALTQVDFGLLVQSGALPSVNQGQLGAVPIAQPPRREQELVRERLDALDLRLEAEQGTFSKLLQCKAGLMDDLLTGRVRVTPLLA